ncbi:antibiotic biosynthesis monooxygenase family protein [Fulvivirgaceae bacterium BMA10]|uniref:Antibiotic biosynthesis monooxygenase family protein n=1 Tax=Splendidivirga corallicola TaxID=3051826 RepID=A0ABT8KK92_9BACT|nr:antibiotic biosynthesis monooxygenase family protein [Fulvivirgaceae bacterium BMA10]
MLVRIVRMTFKEDCIDDFLKLFQKTSMKIRHFTGCTHLELLREYHHENIFITYSYWESEEALNNYRDSELFKEVWSNTKVLFAEKPVAFSFKRFVVV